MTRAATIVWITLIMLTLTGYFLGEKGGGAAARIILALAGVKFALVAWEFMDLRRAAPIWSVAMLGLLALILGVAFVLI